MMKMILNNKIAEIINITNYSRTLDVLDENIRFQLDITLSGDYPAESIEYLANYANIAITEIKITDDQNTIWLHNNNINAKLQSLTETCDGQNRYGYATIIIYEQVGE